MGGLSGAVLSVIVRLLAALLDCLLTWIVFVNTAGSQKISRLQYNCQPPVDWRDSGVTGLHFNGICPAFSRRTFANYAVRTVPLDLNP